jgi:hypothetical protein
MTTEEQERRRHELQKQLDQALADSFPASDPVSIVTSQTEEDWGEGDTASAPPTGQQAEHLPYGYGAVSSKVEPAWFTVVRTIGRRQTRCT